MVVTAMRDHDDFASEFPEGDARFQQLEEKLRELTDTSAERIRDFERRLEHEWLALRQLHEDELKDVQRRSAAAANTGSAASRDVLDDIGHLRRDIHELLMLLRPVVEQAQRANVGLPAEDVHAARRDTNARTFILIATLLVLTGLFGYTYWRLATDLRSQTARVVSAERQVAELRQQSEGQTRANDQAFQRLAGEALTAAARAERIGGVLASADLREFALVGQRRAPAAAGLALWSGTRGVVLTATHVPAAASTDVYQFWIDTTLGPISLGFVAPDDQGRVTAAFDTPPAMQGTTLGFLLTLEHAGGGMKPGEAVVLASVRKVAGV